MKSILIIGASRGIGLELVRQYTEDGRRVIATVRDDAGRERVQALGADVLTVDVANPASVSGLAWPLDGEKLDLAIYVAGVIRRPNALTPPTQQDFDAVMHTNVLGAMQTLPQVAPLVAEARGVFAFLSSSMSQIGSVPDSSAWLYRTSKAALTLARAGRRQALFYVSDEQLAKQTLAPLLLRDEAATLELKLRYDPAWTGYFEYAGYLLH